MSVYKIFFAKSAEKELSKLPDKDVERLLPAIAALGETPRPVGCKKLRGSKNIWRIRVGDYRVVYSIEDVLLLLEIRAIGHRRDVYDKH